MNRRIRAALTAGILIVALSGCSAASPEITDGASSAMQSMVVSAADQAAAGDSVGALVTLDALQAQLDAATSSGDVTGSRAAVIQSAIDLVRADLLAAAPVAPVEPVVPDESDDSEDTPETPEETTAPEETAAPETTVPETTAPEETTVPEEDGNGNSGNGNNGNGNNGNGNNGNGNNKDKSNNGNNK